MGSNPTGATMKNFRETTDMLAADIEHTVGNALFALETNLQPLRKRIMENRTQEALEILQEMEASITKAKQGLFLWKQKQS